MATAGYPLWISSSTDVNSIYPETLNYGEYLRMSQRRGVAQYFQSEASRHSSIIRLSPIVIIQILMDVEQWSPVFCSMVTNAQLWRSCPPEKKKATRSRSRSCQRSLCYQLPKFQLVKSNLSDTLTNNGRKLDRCGCICG
ncbi:hypothetical protein M0R45_006712 [Rubus argutus]|uniref:Uncharacterized protein n=1 Tax=Rubus argutus TaxID=59490 RepID=A0AAW1YRC9_RUBAR